MRHLRVWRWRRRHAGLFLVRAVPLICAAMLVIRISASPAYELPVPLWPPSWCCTAPGNLHRARILESLERAGGRHLLIVRYGPHHNRHYEWVYNEADIDRAKVVWARDMDPASNEALVRYFKDRQVVVLEVP